MGIFDGIKKAWDSIFGKDGDKVTISNRKDVSSQPQTQSQTQPQLPPQGQSTPQQSTSNLLSAGAKLTQGLLKQNASFEGVEELTQNKPLTDDEIKKKINSVKNPQGNLFLKINLPFGTQYILDNGDKKTFIRPELAYKNSSRYEHSLDLDAIKEYFDAEYVSSGDNDNKVVQFPTNTKIRKLQKEEYINNNTKLIDGKRYAELDGQEVEVKKDRGFFGTVKDIFSDDDIERLDDHVFNLTPEEKKRRADEIYKSFDLSKANKERTNHIAYELYMLGDGRGQEIVSKYNELNPDDQIGFLDETWATLKLSGNTMWYGVKDLYKGFRKGVLDDVFYRFKDLDTLSKEDRAAKEIEKTKEMFELVDKWNAVESDSSISEDKKQSVRENIKKKFDNLNVVNDLNHPLKIETLAKSRLDEVYTNKKSDGYHKTSLQKVGIHDNLSKTNNVYQEEEFYEQKNNKFTSSLLQTQTIEEYQKRTGKGIDPKVVNQLYSNSVLIDTFSSISYIYRDLKGTDAENLVFELRDRIVQNAVDYIIFSEEHKDEKNIDAYNVYPEYLKQGGTDFLAFDSYLDIFYKYSKDSTKSDLVNNMMEYGYKLGLDNALKDIAAALRVKHSDWYNLPIHGAGAIFAPIETHLDIGLSRIENKIFSDNDQDVYLRESASMINTFGDMMDKPLPEYEQVVNNQRQKKGEWLFTLSTLGLGGTAKGVVQGSVHLTRDLSRVTKVGKVLQKIFPFLDDTMTASQRGRAIFNSIRQGVTNFVKEEMYWQKNNLGDYSVNDLVIGIGGETFGTLFSYVKYYNKSGMDKELSKRTGAVAHYLNSVLGYTPKEIDGIIGRMTQEELHQTGGELLSKFKEFSDNIDWTTVSEFKKNFKKFTPQAQHEFQRIVDQSIKNSENRLLSRAISIADKNVSQYVKSYKDSKGNLFVKWNFPKSFSVEKIEKIKNKITDIVEKRSSQSRYSIITATRNFVKSNAENIIRNNRKTNQLFYDQTGKAKTFVKYNGQKLSFKEAKARFIQDEVNSRLLAFKISHKETPTKWLKYFGVQDDRADNFSYLRRFHSLVNAKIYEKDLNARRDLNNLIFNNHYYGAFEYYLKQYYLKRGKEFPGFDELTAEELQRHITEFSESVESLYLKDYLANAYLPQDRSVLVDDVKIANKTFNNAVKENPELKTMGHDLYNKILGNSSLSILEKETIFRTRESSPNRKFSQVYNIGSNPTKVFHHTIDSKIVVGEYGSINIVSSDDLNIGKQLQQKDYSIADAIRSKQAYGTEYKYKKMGTEDGSTVYSIYTSAEHGDSVTAGTMKVTYSGSISIVMNNNLKFHSIQFNSAKAGEISEIDKILLSGFGDKIHIDVSIPDKKQLSLSSLLSVRHELEDSTLSYKRMLDKLGDDFSVISPSIYAIISKSNALTGMQKLEILINMVRSKNITETASGILLDLSKPLDVLNSPIKNGSILAGSLPEHGVVMIKDDTAPKGYLQKHYSIKDGVINLYDHSSKVPNRKLAGQIDITKATPSAWTYEHGTKGKKVSHYSDVTFLQDSNKKTIDGFFESLGSVDHNVKIKKTDDYNTVYRRFYGNDLSIEAISKLKNTPGMSVQRFANHLADKIYGNGLGLNLKKKKNIDLILFDKKIVEYANGYKRLVGNADVSNKEIIEAATYVAKNIDNDFTPAEEELISILYPHAKEISPSQSMSIYLYQKYGYKPVRVSERKTELLKQRRERILLALYKDPKMIGLSEEQQFKLLKKSKYLFGSEESIKQSLKQDPEFVYNFLKDEVIDIQKTIDEYSIPDEVYEERKKLREALTESRRKDGGSSRGWRKVKEYNEVKTLGYDIKIEDAMDIKEKIKGKMQEFAATPELYEKAQKAIEELDEIISAYSIVKQADTGISSNIVDYAQYKEGLSVPQSFIDKQVSLVDRIPGLRLIDTDGKTGAYGFDFLTADQKDRLKDTIKNVIYDVSENGSSNAVYWAELNAIVFNPKYLEATTISHEIFHAAVSFMGDQSRRYKIYKEVREENSKEIIKYSEMRGYDKNTFLKVFPGEQFSESKYKEWITEEWLAEKFGEYVAQKDFPNGKLKNFFKELWERIRLIFTNKDALKLFDEIYDGTLQYSNKGTSYGLLQQVKHPIGGLYEMINNLVPVMNYADIHNAGTNNLVFRPMPNKSFDLIESTRNHIRWEYGDEITSEELAKYFDKKNVGFGNILFQNFNSEIKKYYGNSAKNMEDRMINYFLSEKFQQDISSIKSIGEYFLGDSGFKISVSPGANGYIVSLDHIDLSTPTRLFSVESANIPSGTNQIRQKVDVNSKGKAPFLSMVHDIILQSKQLSQEQLETIKEAYRRDVSYLINSFYPQHKKYKDLPLEDVEILKDIEFLNMYNVYIPHHGGSIYGDVISSLYEEKDKMTFSVLEKILASKPKGFNLIYQTRKIGNTEKAQDGIGIIYKNKGVELSVGFHWASLTQAGKYSTEWKDKIANLRDIRDRMKKNNIYKLTSWNEPMLSFDPGVVGNPKDLSKNRTFGLELQDKILKKGVLPQKRKPKLSDQIIIKQQDKDIVYGSYTRSQDLDEMFNKSGDLYGMSAGLYTHSWMQYGDIFMEINPRVMDRPYLGKDGAEIYPIIFSGDGMTLDENGKRDLYAVVHAISKGEVPKDILKTIPQYNVSAWTNTIIRRYELSEYKKLYKNEKHQYEELLQVLEGRVGFVKGLSRFSETTKRIYDLNNANEIIAAKKAGVSTSKEEDKLVKNYKEYLNNNKSSFAIDDESGTYNVDNVVDKMVEDGLVKKEDMVNALLKNEGRAGVYLESYIHRLNKKDVVAVHIPTNSKEVDVAKLKKVFGDNITIKYYKRLTLPSMTQQYPKVDKWGGLDRNGIRYEDYMYATNVIKQSPKKYKKYNELFSVTPNDNKLRRQFDTLQEIVDKKKQIADSFKKRVEVSEETRILKQKLRDIDRYILSKKESISSFKKSSKYKILQHIQDIMNEDKEFVDKLKEIGKKEIVPQRITGKTKLSHERAQAHIESSYYKHGPLIHGLNKSWAPGVILDGNHYSYSQLGGITKNKWDYIKENPDFIAESEFVSNNKFNWEPVYVQSNGSLVPYGSSPYKAYWGKGKLIENGTLKFDDPNYEILYVRPGESVVYIGPRKGADGYRQITESETIELGEQVGKDLDFISIGCEL